MSTMVATNNSESKANYDSEPLQVPHNLNAADTNNATSTLPSNPLNNIESSGSGSSGVALQCGSKRKRALEDSEESLHEGKKPLPAEDKPKPLSAADKAEISRLIQASHETGRRTQLQLEHLEEYAAKVLQEQRELMDRVVYLEKLQARNWR